MKSHIIFPLVLLVFVCLSHMSRSQGTPADKKEIENVKGRPVIIQIEVPNSKVIEKLKKKGHENAVATYVSALEKYNTSMKTIVEKYWTFSNEVLYKTPDEIVALIKAKNEAYTILRCVTSSIGTGMVYNSSGSNNPGGSHLASSVSYGGNLDWSYSELKEEDWQNDRDYWNGGTSMEFWRIEKMKTGFMKTPEGICAVQLPEIYPDTASLVYGIQAVQYILTKPNQNWKFSEINRQIKADAATLKEKVLYIRKDRLDPELSASVIKKLYPYKFKIVSRSEYQRAFIAGEDGNVFLIICPQVLDGRVMYYQYVTDVAKGRSIAGVAPSIGSIYKMAYVGGNSGKPMANERTFEQLAKEAVMIDK